MFMIDLLTYTRCAILSISPLSSSQFGSSQFVFSSYFRFFFLKILIFNFFCKLLSDPLSLCYLSISRSFFLTTFGSFQFVFSSYVMVVFFCLHSFRILSLRILFSFQAMGFFSHQPVRSSQFLLSSYLEFCFFFRYLSNPSNSCCFPIFNFLIFFLNPVSNPCSSCASITIKL